MFCVAHSDVAAQNGTPPDSGSAAVHQVVEYYEAGRLEDAEYLALKLLESPAQLSRQDQSELYLILAFCSIAGDDEENSRRHFISALKNNPNLKADPIGWSPKVRRVFDLARSDWIQMTEAAAMQQLSMEAEICRTAMLRSLLLPGGGQVYKGSNLSGWLHGAAFWGGLAVTIYAQSSLPGMKEKYQNALQPDEIDAAYRKYRNMSHLALISGSFTVTIYSYSALDALIRKPRSLRTSSPNP